MNYGDNGNGGGNYQNRYQQGDNSGSYNNRGGYNLQYNAGNNGMMSETGLKAKLYKLFCKEQEGFYGYMKLAQSMPEYQDEFVMLAEQEYNNASKVFDIYEETLGEREQGRRASFKESMQKDIEKMERHMENM